MGVFTIYFFNRQGTCLYYHEWSRPKPVKLGAGTPSDDQKMLFGLFFQLKVFAAAMDPKGWVASCALIVPATDASPHSQLHMYGWWSPILCKTCSPSQPHSLCIQLPKYECRKTTAL